MSKWEKVNRKPLPGQSNVTFVKLLSYQTDGGNFAIRIYEGFGAQECDTKPVFLIHGTPRYFKDLGKRDAHVERMRKYWGLEK